MARAITLGGFCAAWFITLFGLIGTHGNMLGQCVSSGVCSDTELKGANLGDVTTGAPAAVSKTLGTAVYSIVNLIMVTSGISTLDSTFCSVAKLCGPDLHGFFDIGKPMAIADATAKHVTIGRIAMVVIAIAGTMPLLDNPAELDATTVAGTIVAGLGGPIWTLAIIPKGMLWTGRRPLAFLVPVLVCATIGVCFRLTNAKDKHKELKYKSAARTIDFSFLDVGEGIYRRYLGRFPPSSQSGRIELFVRRCEHPARLPFVRWLLHIFVRVVLVQQRRRRFRCQVWRIQRRHCQAGW